MSSLTICISSIQCNGILKIRLKTETSGIDRWESRRVWMAPWCKQTANATPLDSNSPLFTFRLNKDVFSLISKSLLFSIYYNNQQREPECLPLLWMPLYLQFFGLKKKGFYPDKNMHIFSHVSVNMKYRNFHLSQSDSSYIPRCWLRGMMFEMRKCIWLFIYTFQIRVSWV